MKAASADAYRHYEQAVIVSGGQMTEASVARIVGHLREALRCNPQLGEAHAMLGRAFEFMAARKLGWPWLRRWQAARHFRCALTRLSPAEVDWSEARLGLAASLARRGKYAATREVVAPLLQRGHQDARRRGLVLVGVAAFHSGRTDEALGHWRAAQKLCRSDAIAIEVTHPNVWLRRGHLQEAARTMKRRHFTTAIQHLEAVVALGGPFVQPSDFVKLHDAFKAAGQHDQARDAYTEAVALHRELVGDEDTPIDYTQMRVESSGSGVYAYDQHIDGLAADSDARTK